MFSWRLSDILGSPSVSTVLQQPNTMSVTKKFNYKLVKSGNVILTATSDLKGYIVGQVIQLRTDIENKSGRDTGAVVASLLQVSIQKDDSLAMLILHLAKASVKLAVSIAAVFVWKVAVSSLDLWLALIPFAFLEKEVVGLVLLIAAQSIMQ